jgi:hypothetical protein
MPFDVFDFKQAGVKAHGYNIFASGFVDSARIQKMSQAEQDPEKKNLLDILDFQLRTYAGDQPVSVDALWRIAGDDGIMTLEELQNEGASAVKANVTSYDRATNQVLDRKNKWEDLKNQELTLLNQRNAAVQNNQETSGIDKQLQEIEDKQAFFINFFDFAA